MFPSNFITLSFHIIILILYIVYYYVIIFLLYIIIYLYFYKFKAKNISTFSSFCNNWCQKKIHHLSIDRIIHIIFKNQGFNITSNSYTYKIYILLYVGTYSLFDSTPHIQTHKCTHCQYHTHYHTHYHHRFHMVISKRKSSALSSDPSCTHITHMTY